MFEKHVKIIVSEDSNTHFDGGAQTNTIVNPVYIMRAPFVPTALSIAITIMTTGFDAGNYTVEVAVINVDKQKEIYTTGRNPVYINENLDNFNFNLDLKNLPFMNEGKYIVRFNYEIEIDRKIVKDEIEEPFFIKAHQVLGDEN